MAYSTLKTHRPLRAKTRLKPVNEKRKRERAERAYGPGGGGGDYATLLRHRPCDTCGRGRPHPAMRQVEGGWIIDWERLRLTPGQSECSHATSRGAGGMWWHQVSQCRECHGRVHGVGGGWGGCRSLALELAGAIAWAAFDGGVLDDVPGCDRPRRPLSEIRLDLIAAWDAAWKREETQT